MPHGCPWARCRARAPAGRTWFAWPCSTCTSSPGRAAPSRQGRAALGTTHGRETPPSSRSRWPARVITPKHCRRSRSCSACSWGMVASRRDTSSTAVARRTDAPVSPMVRDGRCGPLGRSVGPPVTWALRQDCVRCSTRPPGSLWPPRTMAGGSRLLLPTTGGAGQPYVAGHGCAAVGWSAGQREDVCRARRARARRAIRGCGLATAHHRRRTVRRSVRAVRFREVRRRRSGRCRHLSHAAVCGVTIRAGRGRLAALPVRLAATRRRSRPGGAVEAGRDLMDAGDRTGCLHGGDERAARGGRALDGLAQRPPHRVGQLAREGARHRHPRQRFRGTLSSPACCAETTESPRMPGGFGGFTARSASFPKC